MPNAAPSEEQHQLTVRIIRLGWTPITPHMWIYNETKPISERLSIEVLRRAQLQKNSVLQQILNWSWIRCVEWLSKHEPNTTQNSIATSPDSSDPIYTFRNEQQDQDPNLYSSQNAEGDHIPDPFELCELDMSFPFGYQPPEHKLDIPIKLKKLEFNHCINASNTSNPKNSELEAPEPVMQYRYRGMSSDDNVNEGENACNDTVRKQYWSREKCVHHMKNVFVLLRDLFIIRDTVLPRYMIEAIDHDWFGRKAAELFNKKDVECSA